MNIDKSLILNKLKIHFGFKKDSEFARFLGIKPQTLNSWYSRNTFDVDLLYAKCVGIDSQFFFTGSDKYLTKIGSLEDPENEQINILKEPAQVNELVMAQKKTIYILEREVDDLRSDKDLLKNIINSKL